jgi:DNA-binding cell septation regulator SpoVG
MEISDVKLSILQNKHPLRAVANVVFDEAFMVHGIRVIQGSDGRLFASMPVRKAKSNCPGCCSNNDYDARFCNRCGSRLPVPDQKQGRLLTKGLAYPITSEFRAHLERAILRALTPQMRKNDKSRLFTRERG